MTQDRATLPKTTRLRGGAQFTGVFDQRIGGQHFQLLARPNATNGIARLGITVGRRVCPRAVDRARIRRLVREAFRQVRTRLGPVDVVVRAKRAISSSERGPAREEITLLLQRVGR